MPIIDVSQKSYRSLVRAAHKHGMSIDRFIQHKISVGSEPQKSETSIGSAVQNELPAQPALFSADKAVSTPERRLTVPQAPKNRLRRSMRCGVG